MNPHIEIHQRDPKPTIDAGDIWCHLCHGVIATDIPLHRIREVSQEHITRQHPAKENNKK